jgi:hypothetical protein
MAPPGRRRSAARGVFAIEQEELLLPDPIALDTSFVVEALVATQPLHGACSPFLAPEAIVTTDTGFALLPSSLLTIYTDRSRLASCRRKRPR